MRIIIVRHGDPNYDLDCLTTRGIQEAECLRQRFQNEKIDYCFQSILGRAKQTCAIALGENFPKITYEWLQEFGVYTPNKVKDSNKNIPWDLFPDEWCDKDIFYDKDNWYNDPLFDNSDVKKRYLYVIEQFDKLLAEHHYTRNKHNYYDVDIDHSETLIFFCHLGIECVLLSRLLNISPFVLFHNTCVLTSSVTTIYSEEREKGKAIFRMSAFSDTSHLYKNNLEPNFAARFCENFNDGMRH